MLTEEAQHEGTTSTDGAEIKIVVDLHNGKGPMRALLRKLTREMDIESSDKSTNFPKHVVGTKYPVRVMLVDGNDGEKHSSATHELDHMVVATECIEALHRQGKKRSGYFNLAIGDLLNFGSSKEVLPTLNWLTRSDMDALTMDTIKVGRDMSKALEKLSRAAGSYESTISGR